MKNFLAVLAVFAFAFLGASAQPKVLKVDDVLTNGEQYVGHQIIIEGLCSHICSHGGKKMFLRSAKGLIRVQANREIGSFKSNVVNEPVQATGILKETRIDEAYLHEWEERLQSNTKVGTHSDCETDSAARGDQGNTEAEKIASFRARIAERNAKEGKAYLSTFYVVASSYKIL